MPTEQTVSAVDAESDLLSAEQRALCDAALALVQAMWPHVEEYAREDVVLVVTIRPIPAGDPDAELFSNRGSVRPLPRTTVLRHLADAPESLHHPAAEHPPAIVPPMRAVWIYASRGEGCGVVFRMFACPPGIGSG